jgi:AcrR family transcriptional regulator
MLRSMNPPRDSGRRLSADDWIQAGFAILAEGGPNALRLDRICEHLGVTKGSFYWHFADLPAYRSALLESWASLHDQDRQRFLDMGGAAPRDRLKAMMQALMSPQLYSLERAMRVWSLTDETVAEGVRRSDMQVLGAVHQIFTDAGFEGQDALVRAVTFFAAGMGFLHGFDIERPADGEDLFLDFMFRP